MYKLIKKFSEFNKRKDFKVFQNKLAEESYDNLGLSYSNSYNEVRMVTELCTLLNGKGFENLKLYSKKIHGSKSYVEFRNKDKPVSTELADMVIISIATRKNKIVFEKTSFVQNKKEDSKNAWKIDQNQLYLLQNFPTFRGTKGIFNQKFKGQDITYSNSTKSLGTYGLFHKPGEMVLISAEEIYRNQISNKVSIDNLKRISNSSGNSPFPLGLDHPLIEELIYRYYKHLPQLGFPLLEMPFLGNVPNCQNMYEFIRNWTLFNIGEPASMFGIKLDEQLIRFNRLVMSEIEGLGNLNFEIDGQGEIQDNLVVFVARIELD